MFYRKYRLSVSIQSGAPALISHLTVNVTTCPVYPAIPYVIIFNFYQLSDYICCIMYPDKWCHVSGYMSEDVLIGSCQKKSVRITFSTVLCVQCTCINDIHATELQTKCISACIGCRNFKTIHSNAFFYP